MKLIKECTVNNKVIEYTREQIINEENRYIIYNNYNNRTIVGNDEVIEYLEQHKNIENDSPLYDFIEQHKKKNILDFNLISILIKTSRLKSVYKFAGFTTNTFSVWLALFLIFFVIIYKNDEFLTSYEMKFRNLPLYIIGLYVSQFIIIVLHEISHYYYYYKYFQPKFIRFGITIRYLFLLLFFTTVPFINKMDKVEKKKLITAGIKTQVTIEGLLAIVILLEANNFFYLLFLLNLGSIFINILPFFKLDGYWYITAILNINDYMDYYKDMITFKKKFNLLIFIIGTLNLFLILIFILYSIFKILSILNFI